MNQQPKTSLAEARAIMRVLGKAEGEFAASLSIPLFWIILEGKDKYTARNGTAFVLNTGERIFGVTACHVLEGWRADCAAKQVIGIQLGDLPFDPDRSHQIIASHAGIDVVTFCISPNEVRQIGKTILTGYQSQWPPPDPQFDRGIYYAGFPGKEKLWLSPREISFGVMYGGGVASSISDRDVSSLIERENIEPVEGGLPLPPVNYNFQGVSGGPMLSVIEHRGLRTWALAGVIYQGPSTSGDLNEAIPGFEVIKARRAGFICPDGSLDVATWANLEPF